MTSSDHSIQSVLPQFPLESVVVPSQVLSLHIFEPRYRQLIEDLLEGDGHFGTMLITRGSEVGGEDQRAEIGTVIQLQEAVHVDDGRWLITAAGIERFRVVQWLTDDPYPRAEVDRLQEQLLVDEPNQGEAEERYQGVARAFRRAMAMYTELGGAGSIEDLSTNRDVAAFQMSALLPVGPLDKYKTLDCTSTLQRLATLEDLIADITDLMRFQLSGGN